MHLSVHHYFRLRPQTLVLLIVPLMTTACLSTLLGFGEDKKGSYFVPKPGSDWVAIDPAEADSAYRHKEDAAILSVSSQCGEKNYRSLEDLSEDVLKQLPSHTKTKDQEPLTVDGNPALVTEARGTVDGHELELQLAVIRTRSCVYDLYLAGPKLTPSNRKAFAAVLAGFRESGT